MTKKLTIKDVENFVRENSDCELLSKEYINARENLKFRCKCGKEFERSFDNFKRKKTTLCQSCSNKRELSQSAKIKISKSKLKSIDEVLKVVENDMKCKFMKRYTKKNTRSTIIVFECSVHGIQEAYWTNLSKRKCCPKCNKMYIESKGNKLVESWLLENNIAFKKEYKFEKCKDTRALPFDFYIPTLNTCIEFDGLQHYTNIYFGKGNEEKALEYYKRHDKIKDDYCKQNNIKLVRIPYFEIDNIDSILKSALQYSFYFEKIPR